MTKKKEQTGWEKLQTLVGETVKDAQAKVSTLYPPVKTIRIIKKDGVSLMITADARPDRINVEVEKGRISKVCHIQ